MCPEIWAAALSLSLSRGAKSARSSMLITTGSLAVAFQLKICLSRRDLFLICWTYHFISAPASHGSLKNTLYGEQLDHEATDTPYRYAIIDSQMRTVFFWIHQPIYPIQFETMLK